MHLKTLTLRGFKSFASATTLRFEPGITCVVGPNGSGKSNVVDAIAWVLGEQGAKALRGGKMEDVIFAGTAGRPPLGRAEVTLTIDNTDGALPIDYTEVSITRRMFRDGDSEYEINGELVRLLDIQELLSDSGIGREMHVIVGQGQLDAVLQARPEDRRGFIEEAAGVLKHRKRKEKALRKLDAMQANLNRLTDLTAELRRQLKPLGRQAEVARRAAGVQADLRDARLRLLADDLVTLRDELRTRGRRRGGDPRPPRRGRGRRSTRRAPARPSWRPRSPPTRRARPQRRRPGTGCPRCEERFRGTASLAAERARHLARRAGGGAARPRPRGAGGRGRRGPRAGGRAAGRARRRRRPRSPRPSRAGRSWRRRLAEAERAAGRRGPGGRRPARGAGQADRPGQRAAHPRRRRRARRSRGCRRRRPRPASAPRSAEARAATGVQAEVGALDEGELGLDERHEAAVAASRRSRRGSASWPTAEREAERERSTWAARAEALASG